jgi:hypothetical protein
MLNQTTVERSVGSKNDWCVGEPPMRWDVSFGARLAEKVKQLFWRDTGDRAVPIKAPIQREVAGMRKAA